MSKNGSQFIINLVKLAEGYAFQSFQQADNVGSKKKNTSKQKPKNPSNRTIHRIFRELALDPQQPQILLNPIIEESEPAPKLIEPQIQQDFSAQINRENGIPESPAKWFDQSSIHQIQKDSLPQFFNDKTYKTPNLYLKFRNFIVTLYRKNPAEYLTKIACRRILRGDVNTIMKIHTFLQKQGIINFGVSKQGNYTFSPSIFSRALNEQSKYGVAIDKIQDNDQQKKTQSTDMTNVTVTTVSKVFSKSNRVFCSKCQSICGILWYKKKQQSQKNISLCLECFQKLSQIQAEQYTKIDIVKKIQQGTPQDSKTVWSIDDNLKLLQFVSKSTQSWEQLQNSFDKKKSFDDIMLQFMQFPIANFDPSKQHIPQKAVQDNHEDHIKKLLQRMNNSFYKPTQQQNSQPPSHPHPHPHPHTIKSQQQLQLTNSKFSSQILTLTSNLCKKFQLQMQKNISVQKIVQSGLTQVLSYKSISKNWIKNQQIPQYQQQQPSLTIKNPKIKKPKKHPSILNQNQPEYSNENENQDQQNEQQQEPSQDNDKNGQIHDHDHDHEGHHHIKDEEFEDFINNLEYN